MNPLTSILSSHLNCFNFWGRASRSEFWWFHLYSILVFFWVIGPNISHNLHNNLSIQYLLIFSVFGLIIPGVTLSIRRLHDTNRSAWWLALGIVPVIGLLPILNNAIICGDHSSNPYGPPPY